MLKAGYWNYWEPRVIFPYFKGYENVYDFVVQESLNGETLKDFLRPAYYWYKGQKPFKQMLLNYWWVLTGAKIKFRYAFLSRQGELLKEWTHEGSYGKGDIFSVNISDLLKKENFADQDGEFLLIASRGRLDRWSSSPGNVTSRFIGQGKISGFRTGFFARPLNSGAKGHFGFTGLNPKVRMDENYEASLMLINHSSEPQYAHTAEPTVLLHRTPTEFLEAPFGVIPPLGIVERKLSDLFPNAEEFLKPTGGFGYTVTKVKGTSLASLHILRDRQGRLLGIEHSRPAHAAVIRYAEGKNYMKKKPEVANVLAGNAAIAGVSASKEVRS